MNLEIKPNVTESEAIALALEALDEASKKFHFDLRAAQMMGDAIPHQTRQRVIKQAKYAEAKKVLQGLRWWNDSQSTGREAGEK